MPSFLSFSDPVYLTLHQLCAVGAPGEGAAEAAGACGVGNATCGLTGLLAVDVPLDGRGPTAIPAAETMSPVFTLWITLVAMYLGEPPPDALWPHLR